MVTSLLCFSVSRCAATPQRASAEPVNHRAFSVSPSKAASASASSPRSRLRLLIKRPPFGTQNIEPARAKPRVQPSPGGSNRPVLVIIHTGTVITAITSRRNEIIIYICYGSVTIHQAIETQTLPTHTLTFLTCSVRGGEGV